ncbi:MAG: DUF805 domain-containing protein [Pseudomonadota bacterium]
MVNAPEPLVSTTAGPQTVRWVLFSLKGRIRRLTYFWATLFMITIWWIALAQAFSAREGSSQLETWMLILGIIVLGSIYCQFALVTKRVHDMGHGLWAAVIICVLGYAVPGIGSIIFLGLLFGRGEAEPNRYGPPPVLADSAKPLGRN